MTHLVENFSALSILAIKKTTPTIKDSTISTYERLFRKLYRELFVDITPNNISNPLVYIIDNPTPIIDKLFESEWGLNLKDQTRKNYISLILTLLRGSSADEGVRPSYNKYREVFDMLKKGLDAEQIKQQPTEKEEDLKNITMNDLKKGLVYHANKLRGRDSKDINSALYNMLGHLHLEEVLRNEASSMILTNNYIPMAEDTKHINFIWIKGRNTKLMVIRNNKVRNPDRYDEPKEVWIKGSLNTAINKYIQVLKNTGNIEDDIILENTPLVFSKSFPLHCISSSHYSQVFKKIWSHLDLELTTTMIRKLYAMDVREKYKGNLLKEQEACEKLDHSKDTHDKHYILDFS